MNLCDSDNYVRLAESYRAGISGCPVNISLTSQKLFFDPLNSSIDVYIVSKSHRKHLFRVEVSEQGNKLVTDSILASIFRSSGDHGHTFRQSTLTNDSLLF